MAQQASAPGTPVTARGRDATVHAPARTPDDRPTRTSRRGHFWIGVGPEDLPGGGRGARGPMYVHWEAPERVTQHLPVVLVHGGGGQGLDYLGTPDGRPGWAELLVERGHVVYVVDRPGHGRSAYDPAVLGPIAPAPPEEFFADLFAPTSDSANPLAGLHTRWPGPGGLADPAMRQFLASSGPIVADTAAAHDLDGARIVELLERVGPAIVFTHSAGGPSCWVAADRRPDLVAALVAVEPVGPPFDERHGPGSFAWGLTSTPLTFDPPADSPAELSLVRQDPPAPGAPATVLQADPPRRLVNLARVPIGVATAEASVFTFIDPVTVEFLRQAGCRVDHLRLTDAGITGNGHLVMLEENNAEVLDLLLTWAREHATS